MIIETIELLDNPISIQDLTTKITNGDYNDILTNHSFLIMTNVGIVKVVKDTKEIVINPTVDLSGYVEVEEGKTLISINTLNDLVNLKHEHSNKNILDNITQKIVDDSHQHDNKVLLDSLTDDQISNITNNVHNHLNKYILDTIS